MTEVLDQADRTLSQFKASFEEAFEVSNTLFRSAKTMYEHVREVLDQGKLRVVKGEWTVEQLDEHMKGLLQRQAEGWTKLINGAEKEKKKVNEIFQPVKDAELAVKHARGEGANVAWLGYLTEDQAKVRKAYHEKLVKNFADAKVEYQSVCGYPDGLLVRIPQLKHGVETEVATIIEKLSRRVEGFGKHLPTGLSIETL